MKDGSRKLETGTSRSRSLRAHVELVEKEAVKLVPYVDDSRCLAPTTFALSCLSAVLFDLS